VIAKDRGPRPLSASAQPCPAAAAEPAVGLDDHVPDMGPRCRRPPSRSRARRGRCLRPDTGRHHHREVVGARPTAAAEANLRRARAPWASFVDERRQPGVRRASRSRNGKSRHAGMFTGDNERATVAHRPTAADSARGSPPARLDRLEASSITDAKCRRTSESAFVGHRSRDPPCPRAGVIVPVVAHRSRTASLRAPDVDRQRPCSMVALRMALRRLFSRWSWLAGRPLRWFMVAYACASPFVSRLVMAAASASGVHGRSRPRRCRRRSMPLLRERADGNACSCSPYPTAATRLARRRRDLIRPTVYWPIGAISSTDVFLALQPRASPWYMAVAPVVFHSVTGADGRCRRTEQGSGPANPRSLPPGRVGESGQHRRTRIHGAYPESPRARTPDGPSHSGSRGRIRPDAHGPFFEHPLAPLSELVSGW